MWFKSGTMLTQELLSFSAARLGFEEIWKEIIHGLTLVGISRSLICMYPHQALPFSSLLLCTAEVDLSRVYVGMYLHYICCNIKGWIHRDNASYELIKIVHMDRWVRTASYESVSSLLRTMGA